MTLPESRFGGAEPRVAPAGGIGRWFGIGVFLMLLAVTVTAFLPVNYVILEPGPITNVLGRVSTGEHKGDPVLVPTGATAYPAQGALFFTTVREIGSPQAKPTLLEVASSWLSSDNEIVPMSQIYPEGVPQQQIVDGNTAMMDNSQSVATATALRAAGWNVPDRIVIQGFPEDSPNQDVLKSGDEFVSINGTGVPTLDQLTAAIRETTAGEDLTAQIRRDGTPLTVTLHTKESEGHTVVGVLLGITYDFPVQVKINIEHVSGPSAGLMLSLGIYDVLTPGSLTGDHQIAGTGTLADDGVVGPIGGIAQKLVGARNGGARYFLAPRANCDEVAGHIPDGLTVVAVDSFDQALADVRSIAGGDTSTLPSCSAALASPS
ncbi:MAG: PDZ domain-containing protein [Nostocoides sp.]